MKTNQELDALAIQVREELGEDRESPIDIFNVVQRNDKFTLVLYPMDKQISGMCRIIDSQTFLIFINSDMSYGRQRYTIAHELYHLLVEKKSGVVCSTSYTKTNDSEKEAEIFASYFLMPYGALRKMLAQVVYEPKDIRFVLQMEQYFQMSHLAMLLRLKEEGVIDEDTYELYRNEKRKISDIAVENGYSIDLYRGNPEDRRYYTTGKYIRLATELKNKGLLTDSRYEEIMEEAFRGDVLHLEEEEGLILDD